ncbi:LysE family translocator [Desulfovibrio sp. JC022]|uniref:LysE family translocator n=1 Tax=Desulfovibrio sp. JC022 TaxID=2593642 RepID=UPI0013D69370|nr:LysE family translocator [Desulfovibrio sp. JC022]NDV24085.1 LysE family translocator [Desulfovibrio sp. JC022]
MNYFIDSNLMLVGMVTVLAVVSPGPDFAIIVRNGLRFGRKLGLATAAGIACGVIVHTTYILLGLGYVVATFSWVLEAIRYAGAAYLIWLGISSFLPSETTEELNGEGQCIASCSTVTAFRNGFMCNVLNPKTICFFMALFTQVVNPETPVSVQVGIGLFVSLTHLLWFSFVVFVLTAPGPLKLFNSCKKGIEKAVGVCMLGLGAKIAFDG